MAKTIPNARLQVLADFRHHLRIFLHFSEETAARSGLQPQQHQLLLQVAGVPEGVEPTVGYAAKRLRIQHHAVVSLSKRCEETGLLKRTQGKPDKRTVILSLTSKGRQVLDALSADHELELNEMAPKLIEKLLGVSASGKKSSNGRKSAGGKTKTSERLAGSS
jgi:DNA-binding MarR family transcriptional regulator